MKLSKGLGFIFGAVALPALAAQATPPAGSSPASSLSPGTLSSERAAQASPFEALSPDNNAERMYYPGPIGPYGPYWGFCRRYPWHPRCRYWPRPWPRPYPRPYPPYPGPGPGPDPYYPEFRH